MSTEIIDTDYGKHLSSQPLTTDITEEEAPGLLRNTLDEKIVKIRPMSTPVEQLSRCAGSRRCNSMSVEYYTVDTKPTEAAVSEEVAATVGTSKGNGVSTMVIKTDNDIIFDISETILVSGIKGKGGNGDNNELVLYVVGKPESGGIEVMVVNPPMITVSTGKKPGLPKLPVGTKLIRMARAAAELDVQTAQFASLPKLEQNNCQIFK